MNSLVWKDDFFPCYNDYSTTILFNNKLYGFGTTSGSSSNTLRVWDLSTTQSHIENITLPATLYGTFGCVHNNEIYFGSYQQSGNYLANIFYKYNGSTFTQLTAPNIGVYDADLVSCNNNIYMFSRYDNSVMTISRYSNNTWTTVITTSDVRGMIDSEAYPTVLNNEIYFPATSSSDTTTRSIYKFNGSTISKVYTPTGSYRNRMYFFFVQDGKLKIVNTKYGDGDDTAYTSYPMTIYELNGSTLVQKQYIRQDMFSSLQGYFGVKDKDFRGLYLISQGTSSSDRLRGVYLCEIKE